MMNATVHLSNSCTLLLAACVVLGCGNADSGAAEAGDGERTEGPLYAISSTVFTPDTATAYLAVTNSLAADTTVDRGQALELPGDSRVYGPEGGDVVYATSDEKGSMTEITFDAEGAPHLEREVSFANSGVSRTTGGNVHYFASPSKAYFVSQQTLEVVVWNPAKMETVGRIPLAMELAVGESVAFYPRPILVGERLVLISSIYDDSDISSGATITVVDTTTDSVETSTREERCHNMMQSAVGTDGHRYFASGSLSAALHFLYPELAPAPCMLRLRAGDVSFDPDWSRTFSEELSTRLWTGVTPGDDGTVYIQSLAEDEPEVVAGAEESDPFGVANAQPWSWHALTEADSPPMRLEAILTAPPVFAPIPIGDSAYVSLWDGENTTLVDVTAMGTPEAGLLVPGFVYNAVRIR